MTARKAGREKDIQNVQKQLERAVQLDHRAWAIKEREKKRAEVLRQKQDKEKAEREVRVREQMGSQRRTDRFGYKSSQFHLGAFFRDGSGAATAAAAAESSAEKEDANQNTSDTETEDADSFGDDGVDDKTLLEALESAGEQRPTEGLQVAGSVGKCDLHFSSHVSQRSIVVEHGDSLDDPADFLDELGSSTQIARELATDDDPISHGESPAHVVSTDTLNHQRVIVISGAAKFHSFNCNKSNADRKLMAPPALPTTRAHVAERLRPSLEATSAKTSPFTLSELESFMDDDLQLTQAAPG